MAFKNLRLLPSRVCGKEIKEGPYLGNRQRGRYVLLRKSSTNTTLAFG